MKMDHKIKLSVDTLKIFALLAMTVDHFSKIFGIGEILSQTIGRMAFPIFAFILMKNFCEFHQAKKYLLRLSVFAIFTTLVLFPFNAKEPNILFTFLWAIVFLSFLEFVFLKVKNYFFQIYWTILSLLALMPLILCADYSLGGFLFLISLYCWFHQKSLGFTILVFLTGILCNSSSILSMLFSLITLFLLMFQISVYYKKRRGKWWVFYVYYLLHKVLLYSLKILLNF